jgi:predicted ATPase/DNA-binding CsgD family transcriptional regulator/DNA-binding XRE family transcriptional regulator
MCYNSPKEQHRMHDQHTSAFGAQLRRYRKAAGLTQEQLAEQSGLTVNAISLLERGLRRLPYPQTIRKLAAALGLSTAEIAAWRDTFRERTLAPARPHVVLLSPPPLIGRETERAAVLRHLRDAARRLVTVTGPGGIGKTSLALQVAADLAAESTFVDGVSVAWLASVATVADVPLALAEALDVPMQGSRPILDQLMAALHERSLLLVLDNLEHLLGSDNGDALIALIGRILAEAPGVALLATSRERLRMRDERVLELGGLALPATDSGPHLERTEAVRLFVERAQRVTPDFALRAGNRAAVGHICRRLEGMPLAIELAAAWTRALTPHEIVAEIDQALDFLAQRNRDTPIRHRSMRAALDHSWNLLIDHERRALARLSVFRGGWERAAAAAILSSEFSVMSSGERDIQLKTQNSELITLLAALIDKSLVRREDVGDVMRYTLHELVRQYAAEHLAADPEEQAATEDRHTAYYAGLLQRSIDPKTGRSSPNARGDLNRNLDNLRAAWTRAAGRGDTAALAAMSRGFWILHDERGWLHDGAALFGAAGDALRSSAPAAALRGFILGLQGYFLVRAGRIAAGRQVLEEGLALLQASGATDGLHQLTYNLGIVEMRQGRLAEAYARFTQTDTLARAAGDELLVLLTELYFSLLAKLERNWSTAEAYLTECLSTSRRLGYRRIESLCQVQLGELAICRERPDEATAHLREALQIAGASRDTWVISMVLGFLALVAWTRRELAEARYLLAEGIEGMRAVGDAWSIGRELSGIAHVELAGGNPAAARQACAELVRIATDGEALIVLEAACSLAELVAQEADGLEAQSRRIEALALLLALDGLPGAYETHQRVARLRDELQRHLDPGQQASAVALSRRPLLPWLMEILDRPASARPATPPAVSPGGLYLAETGETLSPREVEVLRLLIGGATNPAIADTLMISRFTAKNHVASILQKLGVSTRTQAALRGRALGLDPLPRSSSSQ